MEHLRLFDTEAEFLTIKSNLKKKYVTRITSDGTIHYGGFETVDLGLPSGNLWATCNLGADNPTDTGLFYQFGGTVGYTSTEGKPFNSWEKTPFNNGSSTYNASYFEANINNWFDVKYLDMGGRDKGDNYVLKPEYDAAHVNLGGKWRMPDGGDFYELKSYTTQEIVTNYNGTTIGGDLFTSIVNGNTMFIPHTGGIMFNKSYSSTNCTFCWLSNLEEDNLNYAHAIYEGSGVGPANITYDRQRLYAIRPIKTVK